MKRVGQASLPVRFGVLSAVLLAALGAVLGMVLTSTVNHRALVQAEQTVAHIGRLAVEPQLRWTDFGNGLIAPDRFAQLQAALQPSRSDGQLLRVKIFDRRSTLLYSDDATAPLGERVPSSHLDAALSGEVESEIEEAAHGGRERDLGTVLEVYVPIWMQVPSGTGEQVVGAFEMYLPYEPIAQGVAADVRRLQWWLAGGLLLLWAGLSRLVVMASRQLHQRAEANRWLAQHDALTGLPNRLLFADRVCQAVGVARRSGASAVVLLLGLDRFKEVNETLGHHTGDALLRAVGQRLRERLRETDTVARLGGDEFAVLLPEVTSAADARQVADDLRAALRTPFVVDGVTLEIDASVGVASYPEHAHSEGQLMQRADVAMYEAKQNHEDVVVYELQFDVHTPARLALFGELRRGIDEGQLLLHYQPKLDLTTGQVGGVEALVRWQHPQRGLLPPADFISVAEQTGLIRPMTLHILELALQDCRSWRQQGLQLTVAVNLSARSLLDNGLTLEIHQLLHAYALPADALELEITETTAMVDPGRALSVLTSLRALGVRLSIDDYGTGHSSLSYLHQLPVDTLKIDKSFVRTMDQHPHEATIVRSTIELARSLGLQVVAEGVETETAWQQLSRLGCDAAQGYWLARPGAAEDIPQTIRLLEQRCRPASAAELGTTT